ncbi:MAG TPA: alanine racemase [Candidatus Eisenbacteria bacterium]|nr:alanine racemase [Candidatus Eisenbacteria bacterium]
MSPPPACAIRGLPPRHVTPRAPRAARGGFLPLATWVEVDLDQLDANLDALSQRIGPERRILLVVKADAYGHGAIEVARSAAGRGVRDFGVATLHEGMQLRLSGLAENIWVLSPLLESEIPEAVAHRLEPTLPSLDFARRLSAQSLHAGRATRVHVEIDTGMGRTGIDPDDALPFLQEVTALEGLRLGSVYTHFPDADGEDTAFTLAQWDAFRALMGGLATHGIHPPLVHAANSAGVLRFPETLGDLVRPGLAAYGLYPPNANGLGIHPVMTFKSRLVQIRPMPAGRSISYARTFTTRRPSVIGVVPAGYGHGYSWLCSNRGAMLVGGRRAPVVGRVTMDLTMIDLSDHPGARVGDEVVLFGAQDEARLPVEEVAAWSDTLSYEILCTIGKRVTRIYMRQGRPVKVLTLLGERGTDGFKPLESEPARK